MINAYLLSKKFISEFEFNDKLKQASKKLGLEYERVKSKEGFVSYEIRESSVDYIDFGSPNQRSFDETQDWNLNGYATLLQIDYDLGGGDKDNLFPILYQLLSHFPDVLVLNDLGVRVYERDESYEDGFKKYKIENKELGEEVTENLNEGSLRRVKL